MILAGFLVADEQGFGLGHVVGDVRGVEVPDPEAYGFIAHPTSVRPVERAFAEHEVAEGIMTTPAI
jgi:hypothetical protein